jgi:small GTP-binding protein
MIQKKICLLGDFAVGKTSLVRQFVDSIYSEKYITTVGVKIDKKMVRTGEQEVTLLIWDTAGGDANELRKSYLRGSAGIMLVADGTRFNTILTAFDIYYKMIETTGTVPFVFLINKADLIDEWQLNNKYMEALSDKGWTAMVTSAKTGVGVEEAFLNLTKMIIEVINP